jgi:DNA-binding beta-propeller fold protein YncE
MRISLMTLPRLALLFVLSSLLASAPRAAEPNGPPLVLERTIPLPGVSGRIDHMAVDLRRGRLLIAELGNGTVEAVDLADGNVIHRARGLREPQGVGYVPGADLIAVANAGDGSVHLLRGEDLAPVGIVPLGDDADNVRLDSRTDRLVVGYGGGGLALLDPAARSVVGTVPLPAHPEGFQLDLKAGRAYVNVPDAKQIAVVDLNTMRQIATWKVPGASANFPMALDPAGVLATVFRSPARLVLLDSKTGDVTAKLPVCGDADDVFFDAKRKRIYVSCGTGEIAVFQRGGGSYRVLASVATASGARTSLYVPALDRLFVAERAGLLGSNAAIRVYRPAS